MSLRSPIVCILGHVDAGKTSLMDKLRKSHVQESEFGGITQQIGCTYFDLNMLLNFITNDNTKKKDYVSKIKIPGLLFIDTPGHDCFQSQRIIGMDICDIAIIVIDINKGLEKRTIDCIEILKERKKPFIVAVNKLDKLYTWTTCLDGLNKSIETQKSTAMDSFYKKISEVTYQFGNLGLNADLFTNITDFKSNISLVPISAVTNEGFNDLIKILIQLCQKYMEKKILAKDLMESIILEIRNEKNLGINFDIVLINGCIDRNDNLLLQTNNGEIVEAVVKDILVLDLGKEMKNKGKYKHVDHVVAAQGLRIVVKTDNIKANNIVCGSSIYKYNDNKEKEVLMDLIKENYLESSKDIDTKLQSIVLDRIGVTIMAPNYGMLISLYYMLKEKDIPVSNTFISNEVTKEIAMKTSINSERNTEYDEQYSIILCFSQSLCNENTESEIKTFISKYDKNIEFVSDNVIYHLIERYNKFKLDWFTKKAHQYRASIIKPFVCTILPQYVFNKSEPIVVGVRILSGELHKGSLILSGSLKLGTVIGLRLNNENVNSATKDQEVSIRIEPLSRTIYTYGKDFDNEVNLKPYYTNDTYELTLKYGNLTADQKELMKTLR